MGYNYQRQATETSPISRVLDRYWNELHDMVYDLEKSKEDYEVAETYGSNKDLSTLLKQVELVTTSLKEVVKSGGPLHKLQQAEHSFVTEHGSVDDFINMRRKLSSSK